jgi:hypothetical protein
MSGINRQQNHVHQHTENETRSKHQQVPQEKVAIESTVLNYESMWFGQKNVDPSERVRWERLWFFILGNKVKRTFGRINSFEFKPQKKKASNKYTEENEVGHKRGDHCRRRRLSCAGHCQVFSLEIQII